MTVVMIGGIGSLQGAALGALLVIGLPRLIEFENAWLADDDGVAAISANVAVDRPLRLTDARVTYARLLSAVAVPALFLLAGGLVWATRRTQ